MKSLTTSLTATKSAFIFLICSNLLAQEVSLDTNDEIDPHENHADDLVISDEKKLTMSEYKNYGTMTIAVSGIFNVEKEFFNQATWDETNQTLSMATFNIDGGKLIAYSQGSSHGDFRNYGYFNIINRGIYTNNEGCIFYSENKTVDVNYGESKATVRIDNSSFENKKGAEYRNINHSITYIQNGASFVNAGRFLNDDLAHFRLYGESIFSNTGTFENKNSFKIANNSSFQNTGTFTNEGEIEMLSGRFENGKDDGSVEATMISSSGQILVKDGFLLNYNASKLEINGGTLELTEYGRYTNNSGGTTSFSNNAVFKIYGEGPDSNSSRQISFCNEGLTEFKNSSKLEISGGGHLNSGNLNLENEASFALSGSAFYTNSGTINLDDSSKFELSGGGFTNSGGFNINGSCTITITGGGFTNYDNFSIKNNATAHLNGGTMSNSVSSTVTPNPKFLVSDQGKFTMSGTSVFENEAKIEISGEFNIAGGTFNNNNNGEIQIISNPGTDAKFTMTGGVFNQYKGAIFNTATTQMELNSTINFYAYKNSEEPGKYVSVIENTGTISFSENATINVILTDEFKIQNSEIEIVLINGGNINLFAGGNWDQIISLKWEDMSSANNDFDWVVSVDNGIKCTLNAYIPEPSIFGLFAGTLALAIAGTTRRKRDSKLKNR